MKADWNDAPHHFKRKRQSAGKWVIVVAIGIAFTALAVYVTDHKLPFPPEPQIAQPPLVESYTPKYEFNELTGQPVATPERLFWDDLNARNRQQARPKQTVYNDTNYVPKGATNVVDMEAVRQSEHIGIPLPYRTDHPAIASSNLEHGLINGVVELITTQSGRCSIITLTTLPFAQITNVGQSITANAERERNSSSRESAVPGRGGGRAIENQIVII